MKKFFSKALSVVLTLALLATLFSFIGVTASAASDIIETTTNGAKEVYFIDFRNIQAYEGEVLAQILADEEAGIDCTDAEIEIYFSYYLKSARHNDQNMHDEIYLRNWAISQDATTANVPNEAESNQSYLREGMGSFSTTYVCPTADFIYGASLQQHSGPANVELYIWDLEIYLDSELVDTNPIDVGSDRSANIDISVVSYKDMLNAQKTWKITFDNAVGNKVCSFTLFNQGGATVNVEFDYYYEAPTESRKVYGMNVAGGGIGTVEQDGVATDEYLIPGLHHWSSEKVNAPSTCAFGFQVGGGNITYAELYVWNLTVYVTKNPGTENEQTWRQVANADFSHGYNVANNETNGFKLKEGTYGEIMASRKAYRLDYAPLAANNKHGAGWCFSGYGTGSNEITVSFSYKIIGANTADAIVTQDISGGDQKVATAGDTKGSAYLKADGQEHYFEWKGVDSNAQLYFRLNLGSPTLNPNVVVYVWNVFVGDINGKYNRSNILTNSYNGEANFKPVDNIVCSYLDVVNASPVMCLDFEGAEAVFEDNQIKSAQYQLSTNKQMNKDEFDPAITISFDYYLANAAADEIRMTNVAGGDVSDDKTGTEFLQPGRNTFTIAGRKLSSFGVDTATIDGNLLLAVALRKLDVESKAKLYIWNLTCTIAYESHTESFGGYNKGVFGSPAQVAPEVSMVSYADVENKYDANNDGKTNVLDLIRAKRATLNTNLVYDKANLGYVAINAETLVAMKKAVLA